MKEKLVEEITSRDKDFAKWYTDVVKKAELMDYSSVKGCMVIRPYGFSMWEKITESLNKAFKKSNHENVAMPLLIPENLLQKEKNHIEGFAPEVAWVTHCGEEELTERFCIRPTSETLFCEHFSKIVKSYKDLPKLYNQWCSVVRWEKTSRPFLRSIEIFWQEGHTVHESEEEAKKEALAMLNIYNDFFNKFLLIPTILGEKTSKEKFSGAKNTYTIESLMYDGKSLQSATSHYLGTNFSEPFDIKFRNRENKLEYAYGTSWGLTTRVIGATIMVHSDDNGLVLPPDLAPLQIVIIPIAFHKKEVMEKAEEIFKSLSKKFLVKIDKDDKSPGWKFSEYEMKGVPIRVEIGPRDLEENRCVLVRRDNGEKIFAPIGNLEDFLTQTIEKIKLNMYESAKKRLEDKTYKVTSFDDIIRLSEKESGFIKAMWCGDEGCEEKLKQEVKITSRCIPFDQEKISNTCVCCDKKAKAMVYWGKAY